MCTGSVFVFMHNCAFDIKKRSCSNNFLFEFVLNSSKVPANRGALGWHIFYRLNEIHIYLIEMIPRITFVPQNEKNT